MSRNFQAPRVPRSRPNVSRPQASQPTQSSQPTRASQDSFASLEDELPSTSLDEDGDNFSLALGKGVGFAIESGSEFDIASLLTDSSALEDQFPPNGLNTQPPTGGASLGGGTSISVGGGNSSSGTTGSMDGSNFGNLPNGKTLLESVLSDPRASLTNINLASGIIPVVQNIVATVNVGCQLNLKSIAVQARNAEYNPKRFVAVIMRIREPKATALVFQSGKIVVTGAKNEIDCRVAARKFCRIIQKIGYSHVRFMDFTIQNIVASADVLFPIKLETLCNENSDYASYEPELFPGLIYRMITPKVVLLVFVSGKIIITGAKDRIQVYEAFENLFPILLKCKKETRQ